VYDIKLSLFFATKAVVYDMELLCKTLSLCAVICRWHLYDLLANRSAWWAPGKTLELRRRLKPYWQVIASCMSAWRKGAGLYVANVHAQLTKKTTCKEGFAASVLGAGSVLACNAVLQLCN
jgi:hypothetical protein